MYTVVEIGCGEFPTPRFDGADRHIALDIDAEAIDSALKFGDGHVIPVIGDASQIGLRDSCADIVVARNVFGDPALGMSERNNKMFQSLSLVMIQQGEFDKLHKLQDDVDVRVNALKTSVMKEVFRVLAVGGKLIAIEQYTPEVARDYFNLLHTNSNGHKPMEMQEMKIAEVSPCISTDLTCREFDTSWVGVK